MSQRRAPRAARAALLVSAIGVAGCGGGNALLHAAHTLPEGDFAALGGVQSQFAPPATQVIDEQVGAADAPPADPAADPDTAAAVLAQASVAPGVSPFVALRLGLPHSWETGVSFSGRAVRGSIRHALRHKEIAVSLELAGSAVLPRPEADGLGTVVAGWQTHRVAGGGFDVPILLGWRSTAGAVDVWGGARGSFELLGGPVTSVRGGAELDASATLWSLGGVAGMAFGARPVHVLMEVEVGYFRLDGELRGATTTTGLVEGLALTPAAALQVRF